MNQKLIFIPVFAQVLLIFLVWIWLYVERLGTLKRKKINPQLLADSAKASEILKDVENSSDNFENQFEIPVLFFVAALMIYVLGLVDELYISMASAFVLFRAVHALIHCSYNRIMHRFAMYAISSLILWAMWFRLGVRVLFN